MATEELAEAIKEATVVSETGQNVDDIMEDQSVSKLVEVTLETHVDSPEEPSDMPGGAKGEVSLLATRGIDLPSGEQQDLKHSPGQLVEGYW